MSANPIIKDEAIQIVVRLNTAIMAVEAALQIWKAADPDFSQTLEEVLERLKEITNYFIKDQP